MESSITIKIIIGFITLLIVVRLLGKKELSQLTPIDLVYLLVLGGLLEESIYDDKVPFWEVLYTAFLWAILVFLFDLCIRKVDLLRPLLKGRPSIIIRNGELDINELKKNKIESEQLRSMLRQQGIFSLHDVKYAILEPGGQISVMESSNSDSFSYLLVDEGKIEKNSLSLLNIDEKWVKEEIRKAGYSTIKNIFYAEWSKQYGLIIKEYKK
ncbi:DUF421 domain-containing protein [Pseudogracilibacillus sp. SE30717A]|uniref:DUF421 domain-containing protein n=1 Tax=Pseudogracilibacillus sp. SE30717A TaxID=3098293 RepID=UPI00300E4375